MGFIWGEQKLFPSLIRFFSVSSFSAVFRWLPLSEKHRKPSSLVMIITRKNNNSKKEHHKHNKTFTVINLFNKFYG